MTDNEIYISEASDDLRAQARVKHIAGDSMAAISLLTQAIQGDPTNTRVALDMTQVLLDIGELEQARSLFNRLPDESKESDFGRALIGQITFKDLAGNTPGKLELLARLTIQPNDNDARFDLAICLVAEHDYPGAVDHLFEIITANAEFREGAVQEMIINLSNMLAANEPDLAQEYRRRLASTMAS